MTRSLAMQALVELQLRAARGQIALRGSQFRDQDPDRLQRFLRRQRLYRQLVGCADALVDLIGKVGRDRFELVDSFGNELSGLDEHGYLRVPVLIYRSANAGKRRS